MKPSLTGPQMILLFLHGPLLLPSRSGPAGPGPLMKPLQWAISVPPLLRQFSTFAASPPSLLLSHLRPHTYPGCFPPLGLPLLALPLAPCEPLARWRHAPPPLQRWMDQAVFWSTPKTAQRAPHSTARHGLWERRHNRDLTPAVRRVDTGLKQLFVFFILAPTQGRTGERCARASASRFGSRWCKVRRSCRQRVLWRVYRRFSECHCNVRPPLYLCWMSARWAAARAVGFAAWRGIYLRGVLQAGAAFRWSNVAANIL